MFQPADLARAQAALDLAKSNADQAQAAAGGISNWFASLIGADSAAAAAVADAKATRLLADTLTAKFDAMFQSPDYVASSDVDDFVRSAGATANTQLLATANVLDPANAAATIASDTAAQLVDPFTWPTWLQAVIGLAVLVGLLWLLRPFLGLFRREARS